MGQQYDSDATTEIDKLNDALASQGTDELRITEASALDIVNRAGREIGKVRMQDSGGVLMDPATEQTLAAIAAALASNGTDTLRVEATQNTSLTSGQDTVTTAGTAEALNGGTSLTVPAGATLEVKALPGNTTAAYIGDSTVSSANGYVLQPGDTTTLDVADVANVYADVATGGEGVTWVVEQ